MGEVVGKGLSFDIIVVFLRGTDIISRTCREEVSRSSHQKDTEHSRRVSSRQFPVQYEKWYEKNRHVKVTYTKRGAGLQGQGRKGKLFDNT